MEVNRSFFFFRKIATKKHLLVKKDCGVILVKREALEEQRMKKRSWVFKLDLKNSYDWVDLELLLNVMERKGLENGGRKDRKVVKNYLTVLINLDGECFP